MQASEEQLAIVEALKLPCNVAVNAVAGSGKTTTVLFIAQEFPFKNILVLTYNKSLQIDTEKKLAECENTKVLTLHSFAYNYYGCTKLGDDSIHAASELVDDYQRFMPNFCDKYDIIIIDECQDLTPLYYNFCCKIIAALSAQNSVCTSPSAQLCLLGDIRQCIYQYKESTTKYLENPSHYFNSEYQWIYLTLSQSFRINSNMADFINECAYNDKVIISHKQSEHKIDYMYIKNSLKDNTQLFCKIKAIVDEYGCENVMILAPSLKSDTVMQNLSNYLSSSKIPLYYSNEKSNSHKNELMKNKLVLSTIHAAKGSERKIVVLYKFDESFYSIQKSAKRNACNNLLYVALTRASERLIILHNDKFKHLPFLQKDLIANYCNEHNCISAKTLPVIISTNNNYIVTDLVDHLNFTLQNELIDLLNIKREKILDEYVIKNYISNKINNKDILEDVFNINGILIPLQNSYLYNKEEFKQTIFKIIDKYTLYGSIIDDDYERKRNGVKILAINNYIESIGIINFNYDNLSAEEMMKIATFFYCTGNNLIYKHKQLNKKYNWLNENNLHILSARIESALNCSSTERSAHAVNNCSSTESRQYEVSVNKNFNSATIYGIIDCINDNIVWEFKYKSELSSCDILQLALYAYLTNNAFNYKLFNIRSGELITIEADNDVLQIIAEKLIAAKINVNDYNESILLNNPFLHTDIKNDLQKFKAEIRGGSPTIKAVDKIVIMLTYIKNTSAEIFLSIINSINASDYLSLEDTLNIKKLSKQKLAEIAVYIYCVENNTKEIYASILNSYKAKYLLVTDIKNYIADNIACARVNLCQGHKLTC